MSSDPLHPAASESVWDYPRPPRLEATSNHLRVVHRGVVLAETRQGLRILETSHPPVYYFPPRDVRHDLLQADDRRSFCEFKGFAQYWTLVPGAEIAGEASVVPDVAWSYPEPTASFGMLRDYVAFYASKVDACWVDEEQVLPQKGDFYGGWITALVRGPFKGGPGTLGW